MQYIRSHPTLTSEAAHVRTILIIIAIIAITFIVRQMLSGRKPIQKNSSNRQAQMPDTLSECKHCGLHLPSSEAIRKGNNVYCSVEHLNEHQD